MRRVESRVTEDRSELASEAENIARAVSQALGIPPDRADPPKVRVSDERGRRRMGASFNEGIV